MYASAGCTGRWTTTVASRRRGEHPIGRPSFFPSHNPQKRGDVATQRGRTGAQNSRARVCYQPVPTAWGARRTLPRHGDPHGVQSVNRRWPCSCHKLHSETADLRELSDNAMESERKPSDCNSCVVGALHFRCRLDEFGCAPVTAHVMRADEVAAALPLVTGVASNRDRR